MQTVEAGEPLKRLLKLATRSDMPVLLQGRHGIGKSEIVPQVAAELGIDCLVRDLSLMEPPDLIGLPRAAEDGRTRYAPPAWLPASGQGLFLLEELNRCPRYMLAPCLQLLTARALNDYRLPPGWLPCAAINPAADGYHADELDQALLARFLRVEVAPALGEWLTWAGAHGVHEKIVQFVESSPRVFDDPDANPRAWCYAGGLLRHWEHDGGCDQQLLAHALAGVLNDKYALAFLQFYTGQHQPLRPRDITADYPAHQAALRAWVRRGQLDLIAASFESFKRHLQKQQTYDRVVSRPASKANVEAFLTDLPAEFHLQARLWLQDRGFTGLRLGARPAEG
jgi:hypothetical protein